MQRLDASFGASQPGGLNAGELGWKQITLNLADFTVFKAEPTDAGLESVTACLRAIDSIRFIVAFPRGTESITGTLWLTNIELLTKPQ